MTAEQYVNSIAKKIKCSGAKRKDIKQQLLTDINSRMTGGETLDDIISKMGAVDEIAKEFNETISPEEQKKFKRNRILKTAVFLVLLLTGLSCLTYWKMPKVSSIEESRYFDKAQVEAAMKRTVEQLDEGEFDALKENSISEMDKFLNQEEAKKIRSQVTEIEWGERTDFGPIYMVEMAQGNQHFAVGEVTVAYENVSVTYRLTYDEDMLLAGLYVR